MSEMEGETLTGLFLEDGDDSWCFNYSSCTFKYSACHQSVRPYLRYTSASAAFVLLCSIIVFFMKAGFMLVELAFASNVRDRRHVVILKHQDAFASAFGFFLIGFDWISGYSSPQNIPRSFFRLTDPMLWFFKFTFASNAATVVGGVLVTNRYKLRLPAAFLSAFFISVRLSTTLTPSLLTFMLTLSVQGIIHPIIARLIWSDKCTSLSPYRFCTNSTSFDACNYGCNQSLALHEKMYVLDFAGGGAVHMLGGIAGLVICVLAKLQEYRDRGKYEAPVRHPLYQEADMSTSIQEAEEQEVVTPQSFLEWMYPVSGGEESVSDAALGVVILWFCWFAFNCGSTESVQVGVEELMFGDNHQPYYPYYGIPSTIAVNMIMAAASGGIVAVAIAVWAQIRSRSESVNANEIANGILSSLVGITAGCAFVDYWAACLIGALSVVLYHLGCYAEYKLKLKDTAHVVPVHGVCGLWSLLAIGIFQTGGPARCNLHAAFEGLCYCHLRLPSLTQGEVLLSQFVGALIMIAISLVACLLLYGTLYLMPMQPFVWLAEKIFFLTPKNTPHLRYKGGWLFTSPGDECLPAEGRLLGLLNNFPDNESTDGGGGANEAMQWGGVEVKLAVKRSQYGSVDLKGTPGVSDSSHKSSSGSAAKVRRSAGSSGSSGSNGSRKVDSPKAERGQDSKHSE